MRIIEQLLIEKKLVLPDVQVHNGGLGAINVSTCFNEK
jgi:hypothetical protein